MQTDFSRIILVDKPAGVSSFGVVSRIRGKLSREKRKSELREFREKHLEFREILTDEAIINFAKNPRELPKSFREKVSLTKKLKVGHAGTLDPFATGLLIILTGKNTTRQDEFMHQDKTYLAKIQLGALSSTGDPEGEIREKIVTKNNELIDLESGKSLRQIPTRSEIENLISRKFLGEITQVPPLYSAIKLGGVKAYEISRKTEKIREKNSESRTRVEQEKLAKFDTFREKFQTEKSRKITIFSCEIVDYHWPFLEIRTKVSSGTYIRTLAEDIGQALETGAFCAELRREKIGELDVQDADEMDGYCKNI